MAKRKRRRKRKKKKEERDLEKEKRARVARDVVAHRTFGRTITGMLEEKRCVACGESVKDEDFADDKAREEYREFALCQLCQDRMKGDGDETND